MPYLVREHLFIGNIGDAAEILQNGSDEITHILSVLSSASISFFSEWRSAISIPCKEIRKVYVGGSESEDVSSNGLKSSLSPDKLLYSLEYAESRKEGSVLVHCFAGVSRSAAIMTAYLMKSERLSQEDAIESLRQSCESVGPNDGFMEQLKMFEQMGFKVDRSCPIYKRFRLKLLGDSYNRGEKIDGSHFGSDPGLPAEIVSSHVETSSDKRGPTRGYRCKKCRRVIALQENVLDHVPGEGETSFEWYKRRSGNPFSRSDDNECSSIFVEPLRWMTTVEEGGLEGKLLCAHCEARLGYFNWSGIQCSCGSWITPAFQLHKSRVDVSTI
ncbi:hypothetical protein ACS0TY_025274 [Phlomoides rotata]